MPSLPPVSAKIIADAEQFISEFRRAEKQATGSTSKIGAEVDKLGNTLRKKFSLADVGKDILKGFGIGGGFQIAETAVEKMTDYFREAAEFAKEIEKSTANQLQNTLDLIRAHQTDDQQLAAAIKERDRLNRDLEELKRPKTTREAIMRREAGGGWEVTGYRTVNRAPTADELARINEVTEALGRQGLVIDNLQRKTESANADRVLSLAKATQGMTKLETDYTGIEEAIARGVEANKEWNDELDKQAEAFKEIADPALKYKLQIQQVNELQTQSKLTAKEAKDAIAALQDEMAKAVNGDTFEKLKKEIFEPADKSIEENARAAGKAATDMGWAFSSAFEDAVLGGEKLSDVLDGLLKDIMRIALRMSVTEPLGNWLGSVFSGKDPGKIGGIFGGLGKIFGFAEGGRPPVGVPSLVGEQGPELFVPDSAGTVIPNKALAAGGNKTFYIDARGADRTGLARLEAMIVQLDGSLEQRAVGAMQNFRLRGPAFA